MTPVIPACRPTVATVSLANLRHNYRQIRGIVPSEKNIWGIIKANAYGHGLVPVAKALVEEGCAHLAVAIPEEAVLLRQKGVEANVYVLDGLMGDPALYVENRLVPVLHTLEGLKQAIDYARCAKLHLSVCLKFDTGMGRLGLWPHEVETVIKWLKVSPLHVDTALTHLARADESLEHTLSSYREFAGLKERFRAEGLMPTRFSICNSASILDRHFEDFDDVRPGIALYGAYPHERQKMLLDLKPVIRLSTKIVSLKSCPAGHGVGYGGTFVTKRPSLIAMLPIGYADGYPRCLSNAGHVLVRGQRVAVVGRVSMDLVAVDVTEVAGVSTHDEVTLIGCDGGDEIRVEEVAGWADTISYEILTGMQERIPRVYV